MSDDLAVEVGDRETAALEFKESAKDRSKILQAICALANDLPRHGGGELLIGVDDRGNPVDGVDTRVTEPCLRLPTCGTAERSSTAHR